MEPETEILPKNKDVNANPVSAQPQSCYLLPQSRPMTSMHISTMSPQLATNNAAVTNQLKSNTINTQPYNTTLTQPQLDSQNLPSSVQPNLMHPFNTIENQTNNLFPILITYDAKQTDPQTLATPTLRDPLKAPITKHMQKKPTHFLAKTQSKPLQTSLLKVGTKRQNNNSNHGNDDAK